MNDSYQYQGLPLSPAIAEALILELFPGKTLRRHEIVDAVISAHSERGGISASANDVPRTIKKALETLREKGSAVNPSQGFWRVLGQPDQDPPAEAEPLPASEVRGLGAEISYGEGAGAVYVYYLPPYEVIAKDKGHEFWLCKIGRTERDPSLRILSQAGTALPEAPRISRLISTDMPVAVEAALHSILKLRGRHSKDSPGNEWFLTNPDEIDEICAFIGIRVQN